MSKIKWLLEKDTFDDNQDALVAALKERDIDHKVVPYIPFEGASGRLPATFAPEDAVVARGSIQFIKRVQRECPWTPGSYATWRNFMCNRYYPHYYEFLLNQNVRMLPFGLLDRLKDEIYRDSGCVFVRPNSGTKTFTGKLVPKSRFDEILGMERRCYEIEPEEIVVIAPAVGIEAEYRFIVAGDEVAAGCTYRLSGQSVDLPTWDPAAEDFLRTVLDSVKWRPDPVFTADVAKTAEGHRLIELNSFSSCGLYLCNPGSVVDAVCAVIEKELAELK